MTEYLAIVVAAAALNRAVLTRDDSAEDPIREAAMHGLAAVVVTTVSAALSALLYGAVLVPLGLESLQTVLFLLAVAGSAWGADRFLLVNFPDARAALESGLRLCALNCAALGVLTQDAGAGFAANVGTAFAVSVLFAVVSVFLAGILARMDEADLPAPVRGTPVLLLSAALFSMALLGLSGLSF